MLAGRVVPSASLTDTSPSSANASSAVTIRPGFQTKPEALERCECTETIAGFVRATSSARAEENEESTAAFGSVMAKAPGMFDPIWGFRLRSGTSLMGRPGEFDDACITAELT